MARLWACVAKELLLLARDRGGLALLFFMPTALMVVVALVQDNVMKATGDAAVRVLLLDQDEGAAGEALASFLGRAPGVDLVPAEERTEAEARAAVARGELEVLVVVPEGTTEALVDRARQQAAEALARAPLDEPPATPPALGVWFDPTLRGSVRAGLSRALGAVAREVELGLRTEAFGAWFAALGQRVADQGAKLPETRPDLRGYWADSLGWEVADAAASPGGWETPPSAVQQNVPAWGLFGVFFAVVPLAGSLLRERQEGMLRRLRTLPVPPAALVLGKLGAYLGVGLAQFVLMGAVGVFALPLLGLAALVLGDPLALGAMCFAAAAAAGGYGVLVGALARSYEQASTFGAVSVVMAAALGGVMVPVYAMPPALRAASQFSPLGWGLEGFLAVFARGGTLETVAPQALSLLLFAAVCLAGAVLALRRPSP